MRKQEKISLFAALLAFLALLTVIYTHGPGPSPVTAALPSTGSPLDVNRADAEALADIPGIGPVLAGAVIERREELGGFHGPDELLTVPGIGEARLEAMRPYITF